MDKFNGCYFHKCYLNNRKTKKNNLDKSFDDLYQDTVNRKNFILSRRYILNEKWECKWDNIKKDPEVSAVYKNYPSLSNVCINPRDALMGGRTENIAKRYEIKRRENIKYYDVTSMYPFICKNARFSLSHHEVK